MRPGSMESIPSNGRACAMQLQDCLPNLQLSTWRKQIQRSQNTRDAPGRFQYAEYLPRGQLFGGHNGESKVEDRTNLTRKAGLPAISTGDPHRAKQRRRVSSWPQLHRLVLSPAHVRQVSQVARIYNDTELVVSKIREPPT